jgi:hypothetical protein
MVVGLVITAAIAGGIAGVAAIGLAVVAARKIGQAFGRTVEQVYEEQRLADYYNQQTYYQQSGRSHSPHYYYSNGYHHGGHSYTYHR